MSHSDWTDALPTGWRTTRLRYAADCVVSSVDKHIRDNEVPVRLCNYSDVYHQEQIRPSEELTRGTASEEEVERFGLRVGDVLITKDSESWEDIGVPAIVTESSPDLVCGYHLAILRPRQDTLLGSYLLRCLQAKRIRIQLELAATGVTRFGIAKLSIGKLSLPMPPLEEQRTISEYLDEATSRLDSLLLELRRFLTWLSERRSALNGQYCPSPLINGGGASHMSQLKYLASLITTREDSSSSLPYIGLDDIESRTGQLVGDAVRFTYGDGAIEPRSGTIFRRGDVLFGKLRPYLAKCWLAEFEGVCTTEALVLRPHSIEPRYLRLYLLSPAVVDIIDGATVGSKMPRSDWQHIGSLNVPDISVEHQRHIADYLDQEMASLAKLEEIAHHTLTLCMERRASIIDAAVTGQI